MSKRTRSWKLTESSESLELSEEFHRSEDLKKKKKSEEKSRYFTRRTHVVSAHRSPRRNGHNGCRRRHPHSRRASASSLVLEDRVRTAGAWCLRRAGQKWELSLALERSEPGRTELTLQKNGSERNPNSNSKTLTLEDSSVRSFWTYLTASPCYTTNTNKHDNTRNT